MVNSSGTRRKMTLLSAPHNPGLQTGCEEARRVLAPPGSVAEQCRAGRCPGGVRAGCARSPGVGSTDRGRSGGGLGGKLAS